MAGDNQVNAYVSQIRPSTSMDLMAKAKALRAQGVDVIGLGGGEPDFDTPQRIRNKAIAELNSGNTHYDVGRGIPKLRERIAEKLAVDNGMHVMPDDVIVTPGAKMAIYLAVRAVINIGDEVLIPTPSWVSYAEIVRASGGVPVLVPLRHEDNYRLSADLLAGYATERTKMLILCSPNNPTGRMYDDGEMGELIRFAEGRDLAILSDEIYEKISYGSKALSPASYDELADRTITVNGFSKAFAMTGWRLGYAVGPKPYMDEIARLHAHTITGTPPFIQEAAIIAFDCEDEVTEMRRAYRLRRDFFVGALDAIDGVSVHLPEGAFYAWCRFDLDRSDIADFLLERANVIGVPGEAYGATGEFVRFSFANNMEDLQEAVRRIGALCV